MITLVLFFLFNAKTDLNIMCISAGSTCNCKEPAVKWSNLLVQQMEICQKPIHLFQILRPCHRRVKPNNYVFKLQPQNKFHLKIISLHHIIFNNIINPRTISSLTSMSVDDTAFSANFAISSNSKDSLLGKHAYKAQLISQLSTMHISNTFSSSIIFLSFFCNRLKKWEGLSFCRCYWLPPANFPYPSETVSSWTWNICLYCPYMQNTICIFLRKPRSDMPVGFHFLLCFLHLVSRTKWMWQLVLFAVINIRWSRLYFLMVLILSLMERSS